MYLQFSSSLASLQLALPSHLSTMGTQLPSLHANSVLLHPVRDIKAEYEEEHLKFNIYKRNLELSVSPTYLNLPQKSTGMVQVRRCRMTH